MLIYQSSKPYLSTLSTKSTAQSEPGGWPELLCIASRLRIELTLSLPVHTSLPVAQTFTVYTLIINRSDLGVDCLDRVVGITCALRCNR